MVANSIALGPREAPQSIVEEGPSRGSVHSWQSRAESKMTGTKSKPQRHAPRDLLPPAPPTTCRHHSVP